LLQGITIGSFGPIEANFLGNNTARLGGISRAGFQILNGAAWNVKLLFESLRQTKAWGLPGVLGSDITDVSLRG
jgi:hypothetical protein